MNAMGGRVSGNGTVMHPRAEVATIFDNLKGIINNFDLQKDVLSAINGNKAAARRVRVTMQDIRHTAADLRKAIQIKKDQ